MLWIERCRCVAPPSSLCEREDEHIPDCLLYGGYRTDKNNRAETPLMCWIKYRPNEPGDHRSPQSHLRCEAIPE